MAYVSMQDLLKRTNSVYKLVILAARRAVELNQGAGKLVDSVSPNLKVSTVALKEIAEGKIRLKGAEKGKKEKVEKEKK